MKTENKMKNYHLSIAFYGTFRPLHIESETLGDAVKTAAKQVTCPDIKMALEELYRDFDRQRKGGIGIVSACHETGRFSVRIAEGKRDNWLDSITNEMPENPLITY
jgi:hypothetical protein